MDNSVRRSVTLAGNVQSDIEAAKAIARKIMDTYDRDRSSQIEQYEVSPILQDVYKSMNRSFTPSRLDVESYARVLDRNGDGKVTMQDIEALCIRYLVGEDALSRSQTGQYGVTNPGYLHEPTGESVKRSGYGYPDQGTSGVRNYDVHTSGYPSGEQIKRSAAPMGASGTNYGSGQVKTLRRTQLEEARRIFDRFDTDHSGFIDEAELKHLMEETYRILGVNKVITHEDVASYLAMVDTNRDGKISPQEYEVIVIRSLERIGIVFE